MITTLVMLAVTVALVDNTATVPPEASAPATVAPAPAPVAPPAPAPVAAAPAATPKAAAPAPDFAPATAAPATAAPATAAPATAVPAPAAASTTTDVTPEDSYYEALKKRVASTYTHTANALKRETEPVAPTPTEAEKKAREEAAEADYAHTVLVNAGHVIDMFKEGWGSQSANLNLRDVADSAGAFAVGREQNEGYWARRAQVALLLLVNQKEKDPDLMALAVVYVDRIHATDGGKRPLPNPAAAILYSRIQGGRVAPAPGHHADATAALAASVKAAKERYGLD